MKLLKLTFLLVFLLPIGCNVDDDLDCGNGSPPYANITGLTGQNVRLLDDRYRNKASLTDDEVVSFEEYALEVSPTAEYTDDRRAETSGSWIGAAYACSPVPFVPTEKVTDLAVFSNNPYEQANGDEAIAPGERLNDIIEIYDQWNGYVTGLPEFIPRENFAYEAGFLLQFTAAPAREITHTFTVRYELDNGETYEFTAPPVTITP